MLTPQEIAETPLSKVRFGGYDMEEVDDFLEAITEDYSALYKENAILKGKLKVLVEKIEEYRKTEDSMRVALMTAQKVSEDIKSDADKHRESVLRDANEEIKAKLAQTAKRVADEELRLSVAAKETSKFIELSQAIMKRHSEFLTKLEAAVRVLEKNRELTAASQVSSQTKTNILSSKTTNLPTLEDRHVSEVADQIDAAVGRITGSDPVAPPAPPPVQIAAPSVFSEPAVISDAAAVLTPIPAQVPAPVSIPAPTPAVVPAAALPKLHSDTSPMIFQQQTIPNYDPEADPATAPTIAFPPIDNLEETSPRPRFDFDDLRFGDNFK